MKYPFSSKQQALLNRIGFGFDVMGDLDDDQEIEIGDKVGDHLVLECLDDDYNETPEGEICQEILYMLAHQQNN
nr:hypothetical protein [uncultured Solibaculum sp.]